MQLNPSPSPSLGGMGGLQHGGQSYGMPMTRPAMHEGGPSRAFSTGMGGGMGGLGMESLGPSMGHNGLGPAGMGGMGSMGSMGGLGGGMGSSMGGMGGGMSSSMGGMGSSGLGGSMGGGPMGMGMGGGMGGGGLGGGMGGSSGLGGLGLPGMQPGMGMGSSLPSMGALAMPSSATPPPAPATMGAPLDIPPLDLPPFQSAHAPNDMLASIANNL
eukprot:m.80414 g.80414  ORF g.80414 m.80414 type:complete len:214 (+) comp13322_c0_seq1:244-885(+)